MMAQKKARKDSSALGKLRGKTAKELKDMLAQPSEMVQYVNKYVEERAGEAEEFLPELPALALEQDPIHRHKDVLAHTIAVIVWYASAPAT